MSKRRRIELSALLLFLLSYLGSYAVLSRRAFRFADRYHIAGFYFVAPETEDDDRLNFILDVFYSPLIAVDLLAGTGRHPAYPPLRGLGR